LRAAANEQPSAEARLDVPEEGVKGVRGKEGRLPSALCRLGTTSMVPPSARGPLRDVDVVRTLQPTPVPAGS